MKGRSFLTLLDYSPEEIRKLLALAAQVKKEKKNGVFPERLKHKNIVLIFEKTSTRTRCAFEVAGYDEGATVTFLSNSQMGKKESLEDTAKVLGRFYDGIEFRGFKQETVNMLAEYSGVPVWNGLTDLYHPTQVLADLLTIQENIDKPLNEVSFVFIGDARNNMGNSLMIGCAKMGMKFTAIAPKHLFPSEELVGKMKELCLTTGGEIKLSDKIEDIEGADFVYTDVWVSMGEEDQFPERIKILSPYKVDRKLLDKTQNKNVKFMHCLPSFHDLETSVGKSVYETYGLKEMEVSDEVFRSINSIVFDEAENRMHTIKAVMLATMTDILE